MRMIRTAVAGLVTALSSAVCIAAETPTQPQEQQSPRFEPARALEIEYKQDQLGRAHPGVGISVNNGAGRIYGQAFGHGSSPTESAEAFRLNDMPALGLPAGDLVSGAKFLPADNPGGNTVPLMYDQATGRYRFTAVYYTQMRDGLEVYDSRLTLLVRNERNYPLVLAATALRELGNFHVDAAMTRRANPAAGFAAVRERLGKDAVFSATRQVIWAGIDDMVVQPALALEFTGESGNPILGNYQYNRYLTDAASGAILYQENLINDVDVTGNVSGMATTGWGADVCAPEAIMALPYARVSIGATTAYTNVNGNFTIPNAGSSAVTVSSIISGQYFNVFNPGSVPATTLTQTVTPPGPANFIHNQANTSATNLAEVNAYIHANVARDFVLAQNPAYPTIAGQTGFPVNVNIASTCNAFYNGSSINFYLAGGGCSNTANSTVVHHEYGHHVVATGGSGQGAFGEGFGDVMGVLISDAPCLGDGFQACGTCLRTATQNCQYSAGSCSSCGSEIHACGVLLSSSVWSVRNNLIVTNPVTYRQILNNLAVNSVLVHTGTGITPQITIDFLTLDDNDGNIGNGTPHYNEINNGFTAHNLPGPPLAVGISVSPTSNFISSGLAGGPFNPASKTYTVENVENSPLNYTVTASAPWISLTNASGTLAAHATIPVVASLNANANSLPNGLYTDVLNFTNVTSGLGNTTRNVSLEIGRIMYPSTDTPVAIPDLTPGVYSRINVTDAYCIGDVDVSVDISHTYIGDLRVELKSPQGTIVRLHNQSGGATQNLVRTYDDSTVPPDGPGVLANYNGQIVTGQWELKVSDHAAIDFGTLNSWTLRVVPAGQTCPPVANNVTVSVPVLITSPITLSGVSSSGGPLNYIITTLPAHGSLFDPNGGSITAVPYTLLSQGNIVRYRPDATYAGPDTFTYRVNDGQNSNIATVSITVGGPQLAHSFPMDTNPNWTFTGPTTNGWAFGHPVGLGGDPANGYTGTNVIGFNLNGQYPNNQPEYVITSGAINCSNLTGVQAKFRRWLGVESSTWDHARFQVSTNGTTWTNIWENPVGSLVETAWSLQSYNIPQADGQPALYLRWTMGTTDTSVTYCGWNIDDVEIWGIRPPCPADTNGDHVVNVNDLLVVINAWGPCVPGCPGDVSPPGGNGVVDVNDLLAVINGWGNCP